MKNNITETDTAQEKPEQKETEIWAIGGGKGGTGKTFVTSSLGISIAQRNKKVILIDADLGGANLHSFLRVKKPTDSLTDFFEKRKTLKEVVVDTEIPNLRLVSGDIGSVNPDSLKYTQKLKLFRHIKTLDFDCAILDLGAGSHLNTLDSFLFADKMIIVVIPELIAVENLYQFIKRAIFRKINVVLGEYNLKNVAREAWRDRKAHRIKNVSEFIDYLKSVSNEMREIIERELANFKVYIIVNQARNAKHMETGFSIRSVIIKYFGIDAKYLGYIKYYDSFWEYSDKSYPFFQMNISIPVSDEMRIISDNLMGNRQIKLLNISQKQNG